MNATPFGTWAARAARALLVLLLVPLACAGENWPRWRGPEGNAVADGVPLPLRWNVAQATQNIRWKTAIPGEGSSSPIVWEDRVFLTSSLEKGHRRLLHCLERKTGRIAWTRTVVAQRDERPERTSSMTGHAAATPVTDGRHVVAFFGNAGLACYDFDGNQLWHKVLGEFDTELGLASSPIIYRDRVIQVCDHDGERPGSFTSFVIALDLKNGVERWKTERGGCQRSWSTPVLLPMPDGRKLLIVNSPGRVLGYDPETGKLRLDVGEATEWVAPSPVFGKDLFFAASGKNGPLLAIRHAAAGTQVVWKDRTGGPYVCSPLLYGDHLYVHNEQGVLTCYRAETGEVRYRERLPGKFTASPVAGDGKVFATNEDGTTFVFKAGPKFELLEKNELNEYCLASPALTGGQVFIRTERHLYCIENK